MAGHAADLQLPHLRGLLEVWHDVEALRDRSGAA